ncbi:hypothetical protein CERSUDRAFT_115645 [Gelatoporia subvermispora B]|uniref:F-box domain-containing protein n=1 Tax=Ceriporiopsis subvermispora (strain B) TaxID=914234 RepID=M2RDS9_CERS8|nr:hypothetical protein CERSUDRAFT_115645 [Gelatoporia subvermispora B]
MASSSKSVAQLHDPFSCVTLKDPGSRRLASVSIDRTSPAPDGCTVLNVDCLLYSLRHIHTREDALSMALTCRTIYAYAIAYVQYWNISFNEETVEAVRFQLLKDDCPRFQFVRELSIGYALSLNMMSFSESEKAVSLAVELLAKADHLESLQFRSLDLFGAGRRLAVACEENQTLRKLNISRAGPNDCALVNNMKAPLSSMHLELSTPLIPIANQDLVFPDLAHFSSTLEEVKICYDDGSFRPPSAPCKKVRTLVLKNTACVNLSMLTKAFPNIRKLKYYTDPLTYGLGDRSIMDSLARENLRAQINDPWPFLESVTADITSLCILNLRCQLQRLNIHQNFFGMRKSDLSWLVEYLDLIGPRTLGFTINVFGLDFVRNITAVKERYMDLKNLIIDMACATFLVRKEAPFKVLRAFGRLFPSITHLVVRIKWTNSIDRSFGGFLRRIWDHDSRFDGHAWPRYERRWMETLDTHKFAEQLANCLSSVQFLFLEFPGRPRSYWQVEQTKKGSRLLKLSCDAGEDILKARGL